MDEFNRIMGELGHGDVRAPRVNHALTTRRVITMERFYGVRVDDVGPGARARQRHRGQAGPRPARLVPVMILHGFFHGDVHAGNLMLLDDGGLGFLDFGIIGRFTARTRRQITEYIVAFAHGQYRALGAHAHVDGRGVVGRRPRRSSRAISKVAYAPMLKLASARSIRRQSCPTSCASP